jgi:hypothetical protein
MPEARDLFFKLGKGCAPCNLIGPGRSTQTSPARELLGFFSGKRCHHRYLNARDRSVWVQPVHIGAQWGHTASARLARQLRAPFDFLRARLGLRKRSEQDVAGLPRAPRDVDVGLVNPTRVALSGSRGQSPLRCGSVTAHPTSFGVVLHLLFESALTNTSSGRTPGLSPSSCAMRLEDRLGWRLIERTPRYVQLSAQGTAFLEHARELLEVHERALALFAGARQRLAIGISDHVAGPELPALIARMNAQDPAAADRNPDRIVGRPASKLRPAGTRHGDRPPACRAERWGSYYRRKIRLVRSAGLAASRGGASAGCHACGALRRACDGRAASRCGRRALDRDFCRRRGCGGRCGGYGRARRCCVGSAHAAVWRS